MSNNEKTLEELRMKILSSIGKTEEKESEKMDENTQGKQSAKRTAHAAGNGTSRGLPTHPAKRARPDYNNMNRNHNFNRPDRDHQSNANHRQKNNVPGYHQGTNPLLSQRTSTGTRHSNNEGNISYSQRNRYPNLPPGASRFNNNNGYHKKEGYLDQFSPNSNRMRVKPNMDIKHNHYPNNNQSRSYQHNQQRHHNNTSHGKDPNYVPPAFRDKFRYHNATHSKVNCTLIVSDPLEGKQDTLRNLVEKFLQRQKIDLKELISTVSRNDKVNPIKEDLCQVRINGFENHSILEFDSFQSSTLVFACQSYLNKQLELPSLSWSRPQSYVEFTDHIDKLCNSNVVSIANVSRTEDCTKELLSAKLKTDKFSLYPIYSSTTEGKEFTHCVIATFEETITKKVTNELDSLSEWHYSLPNKSANSLVQKTSRWLFSDIAQLVQTQPKIQSMTNSNVLLLLNCVDPLDLKDDSFTEEIKDTLLETLPGAKTVKIVKPHGDYRLNLAHLGSFVGAIFVQFKEPTDAKDAVELVHGTEFNGRTVLASIFNEKDFKSLEIVPIDE